MGTEFGVESPAFVAIRGILSVCSIALLGALALHWFVLARYAGPDAEQVREAVNARLPRWIARVGFVAVAATLARLLAQHAAVFGTEEALSGDSLTTLLFRANWGRSWWLAILSAIVVIGFATPLRRARTSVWVVASAAILLFALSQPLSGHPAAAEIPSLAVATQWLHLIGAGGWVGSLAMLTLLAIPTARHTDGYSTANPDARVAGLVRAFSPTALAFAALLGITGLFTAWDNLGGLAPLWESVYGRTLLFKLGFLSIAIATGAYNWRRVLPLLGVAQSTERLRRSALIELAAALLVVAVTAVLVATPMPGE